MSIFGYVIDVAGFNAMIARDYPMLAAMGLVRALPNGEVVGTARAFDIIAGGK